MKYQKMSFSQVIHILKNKRPVVNMNISFAEELQDIEKNRERHGYK